MKQLVRLLIVAIIAGAVATIIVQRDRLRQIDREQLVAQVREESSPWSSAARKRPWRRPKERR